MDTLIPWLTLTCQNPYMVLLLECLYENIPPPHTPWYDIHNTLVKQEIIRLIKACEVKKRQCKVR